jgi:hypothetical protein
VSRTSNKNSKNNKRLYLILPVINEYDLLISFDDDDDDNDKNKKTLLHLFTLTLRQHNERLKAGFVINFLNLKLT